MIFVNPRIATALLPNVLGTPLYGSLQCRVNALGSVSLHAGKDVAIQVQRYPDLGMPQPLTRDLGMDARA